MRSLALAVCVVLAWGPAQVRAQDAPSTNAPDDADTIRLLQLEEAARHGSVEANLSLSDVHIFGLNGAPRDPERGFRHAVAAAEGAGNTRLIAWAQWRVGMLTLDGVGTTPDPVRAHEWVVRSADNGSVPGMTSRAAMLAMGQGTAIDAASARRWYLRAAETAEPGSAEAICSLGRMLIVGEGGSVDPARGFAFLLLALEAGEERASGFITSLQDRVDNRARVAAAGIITVWRIEHGAPRIAGNSGGRPE